MSAAEARDANPPTTAHAPGRAQGRAPGLGDLAIRLGTAIAIGVVTIAVVLWGGTLGLAVAVSLVAALAVSELYALTRRERRLPNELLGIAAVIAMPPAAALAGLGGLLAAVIGLVIAALAWHTAFRQIRTSDTSVTVFGAVYVGMTLAHLVLLRSLDAGTILVLAVFVSVWANDVFAYLVGSTIGTHKMAPAISPGKSWEGFAAGSAFTILVWLGVGLVADVAIELPVLAAVGVAISLAAITGDLAESRLKREAGVKDSGSVLPGHGGFLDRFDSLIVVAPVAYWVLVSAGAR